MLKRFQLVLVLLSVLCTPVSAQTNGPMNILVMGDSMLATNQISGQAPANFLGSTLGANVWDRSVIGASYLYPLPITGALGLNITKQMQQGQYDWVVMNGGANDLIFGCGCGSCEGILNRLISRDGSSGLAHDAALRARATGAGVIYLGYLRSPGFTSPSEMCTEPGEELERRLARMAAKYHGVIFVSLTDLVPYGDRSLHSADLVHPSPKGSAAIAGRVIAAMQRNSQ